MNLVWILIIVLAVLLIAGGPQWGYHSYGYYPSGAVGIVLLVVLLLLLLGHL